MKEADLQATNDGVFDTYTRAFKEVGRKEHANEETVKACLDDLIWKMTKMRRERTTPAEIKVAAMQLRSEVSDAARAQYKKGPADPDKVYSVVMQSESAKNAIFRQQDVLSDHSVKALVKGVVKQGTVSPPAAVKAIEWHWRQPELGFHDIEQFRGVPMKIEFINPETGRIENIPYVQSLDWHRKASIKLHLHRTKQREEKYSVELSADLVLEPLVKEFGDLPAAQLWAKKAASSQANHSNGS
jgi:hypothetical protein